MQTILVLFLGIAIGIVAGYMILKKLFIREPVGSLIIVKDEESDPYLFLELNRDVSSLYGLSKVTMDVKTRK